MSRLRGYLPTDHLESVARAAVAEVEGGRGAAGWATSEFAPLDVAALDPPQECDRCHRPIRPEDPIAYLTEGDDFVAIVHESCG